LGKNNSHILLEEIDDVTVECTTMGEVGNEENK